MRILVVANYAPPHIGGVEVLVDRELRMLAKAGHEVRLVTSNCGCGELPEYPDKVETFRIPAWNIFERRFEIPWPIYAPSLLTQLFRHVRWCDVVHAHGFLGGNTLLAFLLASIFAPKTRRTLTEHAGQGWYAQRWKAGVLGCAVHMLGRMNVRLAHTSFACHERVRTLLKRLAGKSGDVRLLLFPPDEELFSPPTPEARNAARARLGWKESRRKVLFIGRLSARKGLDLLLQSQNDQYDLVFCGPGDAEILGHVDGERIEYHTPRSRLELLPLYQAADVFALPSRSEGNLVLVAQEALFCGLPVLLGEDPGLTRFLDCDGLYVSKLDPDSVRESLLHILATRPAPIPLSDRLNGFFPSEQEWIAALTSPQEPASP